MLTQCCVGTVAESSPLLDPTIKKQIWPLSGEIVCTHWRLKELRKIRLIAKNRRYKGNKRQLDCWKMHTISCRSNICLRGGAQVFMDTPHQAAKAALGGSIKRSMDPGETAHRSLCTPLTAHLAAHLSPAASIPKETFVSSLIRRWMVSLCRIMSQRSLEIGEICAVLYEWGESISWRAWQ